MRIVFFGTPDYVVCVLDAVHKRFAHRGVSPFVAIVTQPPRPVGRKQLKVFSPVDTWAFKKNLPIFHSSREFVNAKLEADLGILAAYGEIIPEEVINYFPFGILNIHPSLLPKWRGASPVQAPIIAGEGSTGVTIIKLDEKLDHGPIVSQFKEEILASDTTETLRKRLFERGAEVLAELLEPYLAKKITPREQVHKEFSFTTQIKKEDALIPPDYLNAALRGETFNGEWKTGFLKDFSIDPTPAAVERFVRAMTPWPIAWTWVKLNKNAPAKKKLKIVKAHLEASMLFLDEVQLEGKEPVSWKQFKEGYREAEFAE